MSKDCSPSDLQGWSELLPRWHNKLEQRPKGLDRLVRLGIPEALRGEVWQLLSNCEQDTKLWNYLMEQYRILLTQTAPTEQIILRDVNRTYPAHENFRSGSSASLLDSLYKVCKAYAVYDEEVGYCQGLSFLVAALLLHMPEEQAFCVFTRIMQSYGLRDLFRNNFDVLYLKFYQLERLMEEQIPDLYQHFVTLGIEPFMYASQWFLTVFTAKFPLYAVFYIMDIFLLDGMDTIFQVALALLYSSRQDLLALDFEGILKYFRVQMPKRYRNHETVQLLMKTSSEMSIKHLKKYAKSYIAYKQRERLNENPLARLQKENQKLTANNMRLEQENDDLARELVASKINLRQQLDYTEDKAENLNKALASTNQQVKVCNSHISDLEDEKSRLEVEVQQLKSVCRREMQKAEVELTRNSSIICDYKKICSQLSQRLDKQHKDHNLFIESIIDITRDENCDKECYKLIKSFADDKSTKILDNSIQDDTIDKTKAPTELDDKNDSPKKIVWPSNSGTGDTKVEESTSVINHPLSPGFKGSLSEEVKIKNLTKHVDELEVELARTKLALVEAECRNQQLLHDLTMKSSQVSDILSPSLITNPSRLDFSKKTPKIAVAAMSRLNTLISDTLSNMSQSSTHSSSNPSKTVPSANTEGKTFVPNSNQSNSQLNYLQQSTQPDC